MTSDSDVTTPIKHVFDMFGIFSGGLREVVGTCWQMCWEVWRTCFGGLGGYLGKLFTPTETHLLVRGVKCNVSCFGAVHVCKHFLGKQAEYLGTS